jgi:integrase
VSAGTRLTPEESEIFLQSTENDPLHALWALLITSGIRVVEAIALRWETSASATRHCTFEQP